LLFPALAENHNSADRGTCQKTNLSKTALVAKANMRHKSKGVKRAGNLYEKIISVDNLMLADEKARKGKSGQYGIQLHDRNRDANIWQLHCQLDDRTFTTSNYHVFTIQEPKERQIHRLPYYPDRIVHHAVMNVMEPLFVSWFTADTYCCIKKRGIHAAARAVKRALADSAGTTYCLKLDIRKFYPSVNHEILKAKLRRKIKDNRLLWLLDNIIDSAPGLPIGNYLSQFMANMYLTGFDHWLKEEKRVKYYYRYCDDIVILSGSKQWLHDLLREIKIYLNETLKLDIKPNHQVFPVASRGIDFVGYKLFHTHTLLRKSIKKRFFRMLHRRPAQQSMAAYMGWCRHANTKNLIKTIMKKFSDLGIAPPAENFAGDKIKMNRILNKPIVVHKFKIEKSNFPEKGNGMRLTLEIEFNSARHIIFTSSIRLQQQIANCKPEDFPFETTIVPDNESFLFT
jgi:RNA-directed DNA polymerase